MHACSCVCVCVCESVCVWVERLLCAELIDVQRAVCRSITPTEMCFTIHIWALEYWRITNTNQLWWWERTFYPDTHRHTHTLLTFKIRHLDKRMHSKGHCPDSREKGWVTENGRGVSMVTRATEGRGVPPPDLHWEGEWLSLSSGKTASGHNATDKSERERGRSAAMFAKRGCEPWELQWSVWAT